MLLFPSIILCSFQGVFHCSFGLSLPFWCMQGQYEVLSFMGSYTVAAYRRAGMFTVSLAKPDGNVIGGEVEGPLIAAIPVQVRTFLKYPSRIIIYRTCISFITFTVAHMSILGVKIINPSSWFSLEIGRAHV